MSMEIYVLSDARLSSLADWQTAIDADGFALELSAERPLSDIGGFLPIRLSCVQSGFECDHWDVNDIFATYSDKDFGRRWRYALAFRWGADLRACIGAYMAAAAYAAATQGVVFDCEQGKILSSQQAADVARDMDRQMPEIEVAIRRAVEQFKT
ncbi:MAG: hypothetical protein GC182_06735 [Rhodopseudomonas sp.]|nr:hypothetical protein [Rhodopseudomonas sp.]